MPYEIIKPSPEAAAFILSILKEKLDSGLLLSSSEILALTNNERYGRDVSQFFDMFYNFAGKTKTFVPSAVAEYITEYFPYIILEGIFYIYADGVYKKDEKQSKLKVIINNLILPEERRKNKVLEVIELLKSQPFAEKDYSEINLYPEYCIAFKNGLYDLKAKKIIPYTKDHFCVNQLPHEYNPAADPKGKTVKKYLIDTIPDEANRKMLLTFIGYSMTKDTSMQRFLVLYGRPGTGKSTMLDLISFVIGDENISGLTLQQLCDNHFAAYGIVGKLLNVSADIEAKAIEDPAVMKKLIGEDAIQVEPKGVNLFKVKPYARYMFSANELPPIRSKDDAFFRRVMPLSVDKQPEKVDPELKNKLREEVDYMIHLCVTAAENYYAMEPTERTSIISPESKQLTSWWQSRGDTIAAFLMDEVPFSESEYCTTAALFKQYEDYCSNQGRTPLSKYNFRESLKTKGFDVRTIHGNETYKCPAKYRTAPTDFMPTEDAPFN